jgi:hypothetical protein
VIFESGKCRFFGGFFLRSGVNVEYPYMFLKTLKESIKRYTELGLFEGRKGWALT